MPLTTIDDVDTSPEDNTEHSAAIQRVETASLHSNDDTKQSAVANRRTHAAVRQVEASSLQLQLDLLCHDFPRYEQQLRKVNLTLVADLCSHAEKALSVVDLRYLICFLTDLTTTEVAEMFSVEPPSIYIARYRLRRKFPDNYKLPI